MVSSSFFIKARRINSRRASETELSLAMLHKLLDIDSAGGGGGSALDVHEEGSSVDAAVTTIDFIGAAVTATSPGAGLIDVTITGEANATADQSDAEIEAAYDAQVGVVSQVNAEAGTSTTAERWTPQRVAQAIAALESAGAASLISDNVYQVEHQLAATNSGGTATSGSWQTYTLQTEIITDIVGASLATNQVTLPAGTYRVEAQARFWDTQRTSMKLYNVTDAADEVIGHGCYTNDTEGEDGCWIDAVFTIAAEKDFELRYYCDQTKATNGLGVNQSHSIVEKFGKLRFTQLVSQSAEVVTGTLHTRDEQTSGTAGGATSATTWNVRVLNTTPTNTIAGASVATNQITLPAGDYEIDASAVVHRDNGNKLALYDTTGTAYLVVGPTDYSSSGTGANSPSNNQLRGRFNITVESVLELRHYTVAAKTVDGLGIAVSSGQVEVYADCVIRQLSL